MDYLENGWLIKKRIILSAGNRRDIEQIEASLTTTNDILGRSFASWPYFRLEAMEN
jgi:hypothetical protein